MSFFKKTTVKEKEVDDGEGTSKDSSGSEVQETPGPTEQELHVSNNDEGHLYESGVRVECAESLVQEVEIEEAIEIEQPYKGKNLLKEFTAIDGVFCVNDQSLVKIVKIEPYDAKSMENLSRYKDPTASAYFEKNPDH